MRVVLSTFDSRGGVEPLAALAVRLRELGAEALVCAPPDCADWLIEVGVAFEPIGMPVRALVHGVKPPSPADVPRRAAEIIAAQFDKLLPAARGSDVMVASGVVPAVAGAKSVAEQLGIPSFLVHYCPIYLPSPHQRPQPLPGRPIPVDETDNEVLHAIDVENYNALFRDGLNTHRASAGLPRVHDVRAYVMGDQAWVAADPTLAPFAGPGYVDVVQTGAWILPDERPLSVELEAFLDAGDPPVFVGFGSMRAPENLAQVAIDAVRTQGRRVVLGRGWADLALTDDRDDCFAVGEVNQQALFRRVAAVVHHGGAGTTHTATRAGVPQVVVPQMGDQPYWAGRVAELSIGVAHDGPTPTTESLSAALGVALTPEVRARATEVAGTIRTDGTAVAARLLLDAVS